MSAVTFNEGQKVWNIPGTGPCRTSDGSWKQYWVNRSGIQWPGECCINQCTKSATDGAHVRIDNIPVYYILPMCHSCNTGRLDQWLEVKANSKAVPVLQQNTTGPGNCFFPPKKKMNT